MIDVLQVTVAASNFLRFPGKNACFVIYLPLPRFSSAGKEEQSGTQLGPPKAANVFNTYRITLREEISNVVENCGERPQGENWLASLN